MQINDLRPLLERGGSDLANATNLKPLVPRIEEREFSTLRKELDGHFVTLTFDGTTRIGEVVNVVARYVTDDFILIQRLVAVKTAKKAMKGDELSRFMNQIVQRGLQLDASLVVGGSRDSCSTNGVAIRLMETNYQAMQDLLCISHTLSHTGEHADFQVLDAFMTPWLTLVTNHPMAKTIWKGLLGVAMKGFSKIRWWSRWECIVEIATNYGALPDYIQTLTDRDIGDKTTKKLAEVVRTQSDELAREAAAAMDLRILCEATHRMEGDNLEILVVFPELTAILTLGLTFGDKSVDVPNLAAVLRKQCKIKVGTPIYEYIQQKDGAMGWSTAKVSKVNAAKKEYSITYTEQDGSKSVINDITDEEARRWIDVTKLPDYQPLVDKCKSAFTYLQDRIDGNCDAPYKLGAQWTLYRLVQAFDPSFIVNVDDAFIQQMSAIRPFTVHIDLVKLQQELPTYKANAAAFTADHKDIPEFTKSVLGWWANYGTTIPEWSKAAKIVFSFTPNSASSERVFSLMKLMFGDQQMKALADIIQTALMLRYNKRRVG